MFLRFARKSKVGELQKDSVAVIEGKVVPKSLLKLPQSTTKCVYYDVLKEVYRRGDRGAGRKLWMPQAVEQKLEGFYVEDDTGRIWIAARGEEMDVNGALVEAGMLGQKGRSRYTARVIQEGFIVRVRGLIDEARRGEPSGSLVMRPGRKGRLELLVRKKSS